MPAPGVTLPEHLEGHGIVVRRWRPADAEELARAVAESVEHLRPWMEWVDREPLSVEGRRTLIKQWEATWFAGGDVLLGVFSQGRIAGGCGLHRRIGPRGLEIGYWVHPALARQGLASRATALLISGAFGVPGIDHVEIHHDKANVASSGVPRKLGFEFFRETRDRIEAPAEMGVEWSWRMTRERWLALEPGLEFLTDRRRAK